MYTSVLIIAMLSCLGWSALYYLELLVTVICVSVVRLDAVIIKMT